MVALVITIVLLLILAGISIAQLTGSGLFEKARLAEQKAKEAQEKENSILGEYEKQIDLATRNNNNIQYSLTEQNTGNKWINGKPIYRKVIEIGILERNVEVEVCTINDIECLITGTGFSNDGTVNAIIPSFLTGIYRSGSSIYMYQNGLIYTNKPITIILEYTKTTD